jgi:moderate conductance mechanosensitive channel
VVRINNLSGQVEGITLRMTALRDLEGNVHFIPNGEIKAVTNMTHGWSRAVIDLPIAYQDDLDQVTELIVDVGRQMRGDPDYAAAILDDPTVLGVDALGENGVILKFYITTAPRQQWRVRRELLARIKRRFDELGIALPFAQRTAYQPPAAAAPDHASAGEAGPRRSAPS